MNGGGGGGGGLIPSWGSGEKHPSGHPFCHHMHLFQRLIKALARSKLLSECPIPAPRTGSGLYRYTKSADQRAVDEDAPMAPRREIPRAESPQYQSRFEIVASYGSSTRPPAHASAICLYAPRARRHWDRSVGH